MSQLQHSVLQRETNFEVLVVNHKTHRTLTGFRSHSYEKLAELIGFLLDGFRSGAYGIALSAVLCERIVV
jgi:hypothetical protein